jgi:osmotically-inducible protein OsmY
MTARLRAVVAAALALAIGVAPFDARAAASSSDLWTTIQVKLDLVRDARTDAVDIEVDTAEGLVTLHGVATNDEEKAKAESIARGVGGMRPVRNLIQVIPDAERAAVSRSDEEIRRDVVATLDADAGLGRVRVASANRGVVVLSGRVGSLAAHLRAIELVGGVSGVRHVASELRSTDRVADAEIWRDTLTLFEPPAEPLRDAWITTAVELSLLASEVSDLELGVHTRAGVVTLFGIVESERQQASAVAAARQVALVRAVRNELQVVPPSERAAIEQRDAQIRPQVERRLAMDGGLARAGIDVNVSNGVVWLEGDVGGRGERLKAITLARTTGGVRAVLAALDVKSK